MFGDGEFQASPRKLQMKEPGPGAVLFAHKLDTWKIENYYNGWPVPQNHTLAQHQLGSLHSVGLWWYTKLKGGYHLHPTNLEDERYQVENEKIIARRRQMTIYKNGLEEFLTAIRDLPEFGDAWRSRQPVLRSFTGPTVLDWNLICQRLSEPFAKGPYFGQTRITVYAAIAETPAISRWKSHSKVQRAIFWTEYYTMHSNWVVFLPKTRLYELYAQEAASRTGGFRGSWPASETEFWTTLEKLYCKIGTESASIMHQCMAHISIDQPSLVWHPVNAGPGAGRTGRPRNSKSKVAYVELASLEACRREFARSMYWEPELAASMWMDSSPFREDESIDEPWYWFGDKKSREQIHTKYG
jgi:hypothetical protein